MPKSKKHIILGAGGAISRYLTRELLAQGFAVKWFSRSRRECEGVESVKGDLLNHVDVCTAIEPEATVYLLAGLEYRLKVWLNQWPKIMETSIAACAEKGASLIFFDNVYMYGPVKGPITECSPVRPSSRKGHIRAEIAQLLMHEAASGRLRALIARSADFYGPYADSTSILNRLVLANYAKGKSALWMGDPRTRHSFTFTGDCGRALSLLACDPSAYGQVWHLPTASAMTGTELMELAAREAGVLDRSFSLKRWMSRVGGLLNPTLGEMTELFYQFDSDYEFDSSKFEKHFRDFGGPTPYEKGIRQTLDYLRNR